MAIQRAVVAIIPVSCQGKEFIKNAKKNPNKTSIKNIDAPYPYEAVLFVLPPQSG